MQKFSPAAGYFKLLSNRFTQFCFFIRTLIFLYIYFRMCIFSLLIILCLKCQELIFAMFQFSPGVFFRDFVQTSIGSNFRTYLQAHKYCQEFDMLACILFTLSLLFSCVLIFVDGNFCFFSGRENYNRAKINFLNIVIIKHSLQ